MAEKRLSIGLFLNDKQFQSGLRKASRSMQKFGKSMQRTGQTLTKSLTLPIAAFGAASVKAFDEQIKAETKLRTALGEDEKAFARLKKQAQDLQKITLFGDEATIEAQAFLAQLGLTEEQIKMITPALQDFATGMNVDLKTAASLVGKTVGTTTDALKRYFDTGLDPAMSAQEKAIVLTQTLTEKFGGQAEAVAKQGLGPLQQLKNELGDVGEEFGKLILENIEPLKTSLQGLAENLRSLSTEQKQTIIKIAGIAAAVGPLLIILGKLITAVGSLGKALIFLAANPMVLIATAIGGLVALLGFAVLDMEGFIETALTLGKVGRLTAKAILGFSHSVGLISTPDYVAAISTMEAMSKEQETLASKTEDSTKAIEEQKKEIDKLIESMSTTPSMPTGDGGMQSTGILSFEPIAAGPIPLSSEALDTTPLETYSTALTDLQIKMQDTANTFESAFHSMAVSSEASSQDMIAAAANAARAVIKTAVAEATAKYAAQIFSSVPFPFNLALAAAAGSVVGSLFNKIIPPFADGGIVSGPTLGLIGEYASARTNPEVIAPLDKLQGMIGNAGGQVEVVGRISGSDILLASDRARGNRNRTRGY